MLISRLCNFQLHYLTRCSFLVSFSFSLRFYMQYLFQKKIRSKYFYLCASFIYVCLVSFLNFVFLFFLAIRSHFPSVSFLIKANIFLIIALISYYHVFFLILFSSTVTRYYEIKKKKENTFICLYRISLNDGYQSTVFMSFIKMFSSFSSKPNGFSSTKRRNERKTTTMKENKIFDFIFCSIYQTQRVCYFMLTDYFLIYFF